MNQSSRHVTSSTARGLILFPRFNKDTRLKVFLTGATGFIGSQLAHRLAAEGHEVAIVVRPASQLDTLQTVLPRIQVHVYDGSYASLLHALEAAQPEVVIHVASLFLAQHKPEDVERLVASNLSFPTELLEAMSQLGIRQLINTGTSWQHYQNEAYNPVNLYAATKQAFEVMLCHYVEVEGFKSITLKLFDTYGPGDTRPKLFTLLHKTAKSGETLCMSLGEQMLDLVYIDDVIDAYMIAANRLLQNKVHQQETFVVSSEKQIKLRDLVAIYCQLLGRQISIQWGARPYRPREVMIPWNKGERLPGWEPKIAVEDGIKRAFVSTDSDKYANM